MDTRISGRNLIGVLVILIGVGFLLDSLHLWQFGQIIGTWWPMIIILIGLIQLSNPAHHRTVAYIILAVGIIFQLDQLHLLSTSAWALFWPAIIILIGLSFFTHDRSRLTTTTSSEKTVNVNAFFSGVEKTITAADFEGGVVSAMFGGAKLDLRQAKITDTAAITATAAFGGIEILVSPDVAVEVTGTPIFGGFTDHTTHRKEQKQKLIVTGSAWFGGVEIKN